MCQPIFALALCAVFVPAHSDNLATTAAVAARPAPQAPALPADAGQPAVVPVNDPVSAAGGPQTKGAVQPAVATSAVSSADRRASRAESATETEAKGAQSDPGEAGASDTEPK
jgi:hypothetical protein